jgi:PAS domain S-box-containing protein
MNPRRAGALFAVLTLLGGSVLALATASLVGMAPAIALVILAAAGLVFWLVARQGVAQERTQEELRRNQARFAGIISSAMDAIISVDADQRIVLFNAAAEQMFGCPASEALGQSLDRFIPERYRVAHREHVMAFGRTHETRRRMGTLGSVIGLRANGDEFPLEASISHVESAGQKVYTAILRDLSEKKKMEAQFLRAQRLESIGTLAGGIAHDLNNILTPITMSVKLLKKDRPEHERQGLLGTLQTSAERATELVKQVLAFAGGIEGERAPVQMKHVITEVTSILQHTLPKAITVRTELEKQLSVVRGDVTQLSQVLMNLCVNARDAMPGGGELTISAKNLNLDENFARTHLGASAGPYVAITVEDTGTGMPPEVMDKMFDPFFTTKEHGKGTGLGLSTVLGIVKSHGGFISVYSQVGQGSSFVIYLPAAAGEAAKPAPVGAVVIPAGHGELVLVVDDEPAILETTRVALQSQGYRTVVAGDGQEALTVFRKQHENLRAVVLDMMMPVMDGPTAMAAMQTINPRVPIIAASGLRPSGPTADAVARGAKAFLHKPYTAEQLLETVGRVVASIY